jgi:hypothetical protein
MYSVIISNAIEHPIYDNANLFDFKNAIAY